MSLNKVFNLTRRSLTQFPQLITSYFNNSRNYEDNNAKLPSYGNERKYSKKAGEGIFPSFKAFSKRISFYDRSEPEEEVNIR